MNISSDKLAKSLTRKLGFAYEKGNFKRETVFHLKAVKQRHKD